MVGNRGMGMRSEGWYDADLSPDREGALLVCYQLVRSEDP